MVANKCAKLEVPLQLLGRQTLVSKKQSENCKNNLGDGHRIGIKYAGDAGTFLDHSGGMLRPDPLGSSLTYVFQGDGIAIASNNIADLIHEMRSAGISVKINAAALGGTLAMGNLQSIDLPVEGAKFLPVQSQVYLANGQATITSARDNSVDTLTDEALRDRAIDEILENLNAIAIGQERIVLEMTGGLDSRVTLAAALHLGLHDRLDFLTRGNGTPDRICSERFAHAFDIDLVNSPYSAELISDAEFEGNGAFCAGVRWLDDVAFRMVRPRIGFRVITGAMGELWRNYYSEVQYYKFGRRNDYFDQPMTEPLAKEMFALFAGRRKLLADEKSAEDLFVSQLCSDPGSVGQRLFDHYIGFRNRIHYGGAATARQQYFQSFDPLYSVSGYELARRKDTEWQLFGELSFEIIDRLFPALNSFPLAEKEIAPRFASAAREERFIKGRRPMQGMRERAPIKNIEKYPSNKEKANDIMVEYTLPRLEKLAGVLNLGLIHKQLAEDPAKHTAPICKMGSTGAMLMELVG
ncbi:hypothetical protein BN949_05100 [Agrobacterium tumefaciens]|nr:hypothetical protein BN949_05100 [Agrobacterium tumefaciens]